MSTEMPSPTDQPSRELAYEGEGSDWEYEYHETETETFYVTLDISSAPSTRPKPKPNQNKGASTSATADPNQTFDEVSSPSPEPVSNLSTQPENPSFNTSNRIQILDFHTSNPLISFNDQLYTCSWATTIGTDLILNPTQPTSGDSPNPILAATRHKLSASPASLVPRREPRSSTSSLSIVRPQDIINFPSPDSSRQTRIPLESHASLARQRQAAFLENFIAIKAARGEKDEVTVYAQKRNTGTGWRSQRRARLEEKQNSEITAKAGNDKEASNAPTEQTITTTNASVLEPPVRYTTGRPRGRRSRAPSRALPRAPHYRGRKYKGTFFQGSDPHTDVGSESVPTPKRWDDLDQGGNMGKFTVDGEGDSLRRLGVKDRDGEVVEGDAGKEGDGEAFFVGYQEGFSFRDQERRVGDKDVAMGEGGLMIADHTEDVVMEEA